MSASVYDAVIGQDHTLVKLRALADSAAHAYLFAGPSGCGKDIAARAFAAVKLQGSEDSSQRTADLVMRGIHVDVHEVEREGAGISMEQARDEIIKLAERSAVEGSTRAIIVHDFHLLADGARASLLKTIEEPDGQTIMIMLSDDVPDTMVTIASRCVRIDFQPITDELVVEQLVLEGVDRQKAVAVARVAAGDLERARVLINDASLASRTELFANVPSRLDGTTSRAIELAAELLGAVESSLATYESKQQKELEELEERVKFLGERGSGRKVLADKHKRELRRYRTDELRSGLRMLTLVYSEALRESTAATAHHQTDAYVRAVKKIRDVNVALSRNVNEKLLFENLLMSLPSINN